ncbi:MAG: TraR/DksA family transcriptional regulator, partial [Pseudomonas sp.]
MTKEKLLAMPADDYMNAEQLAFFTGLLQSMKIETQERIEQSRVAIESLDTP